MASQEIIRGTVEKLHYANERWCAGRLFTSDGNSVSFAGTVSVRLGELVALRGRWTVHKKWGKQFEAEDIAFEEKIDKNGLAAWLSTHEDAHGIGLVRARRVADQFGDNFTLALKFQPENVARVAGVSVAVIEKLTESWIKQEEFNAVGAKLSTWGLTRHQIETLFAEFGNDIIRILEENPYALCHEVEGFGFRRVDDIAQKLGVAKTHPGRIRAAVQYVVTEALGEGSTCVAKLDLLTKAERLLALDQLEAPDLIMTGIEESLAKGSLATFGEGEWYAQAGMHRFEQELLDWLSSGDGHNPHFHPEMLSPTIDAYCGKLDGSQMEAAYKALGHRLTLISGGAGSGKTYTINALCDAYESSGKHVSLCAPTGKAARRLEQVTGRSAQTIHRLLEYGHKRSDDPDDPSYYRNKYGFARNERRPLTTDVVIVDEVSMVDVAMGRHLCVAIKPSTAVVLVGDHNQLPAVGPGAVLRDCLAHNLVPATVLRHCFRQAGPLKQNSSAILVGHLAPSEPDPESGPAPWYVHRKLRDPASVMACLERLFTEVIPQRWGFDPVWDVQYLTPMRKLDAQLNTRKINVLLQRLYQQKLGCFIEPAPDKGRLKFYEGDKVINTRNNYKLDVMNGSQGVVVQAQPLIVEFDGVACAIPEENRGDIELAYCITVHKAQGSEWPCVVTICHRVHSFMHHRNWIYTAVTRAAKVSVVLGDAWAIDRAVQVVKENDRKTYLDFAGQLNEEVMS